MIALQEFAKLTKLDKECKKCETVTLHRFVKNETNGYYTCSVCSESASIKYRHKHWFRYLAQKANTRKEKIEEKMTEGMLKSLYEKQGKVCAISGMPFNMKKSLYRPSLDRIDNNIGYREDNIQLVLFIVNKMKRELNETEFKIICYNITDLFKTNEFLGRQGAYIYQE